MSISIINLNRTLFFFLLYFNPFFNIRAIEIFVSPIGDNIMGNGTIDNPYKSLDHVSTFANPGDIVYLRGNASSFNFRQTWSNRSGNASNPIIIMNYNNENVVIDINSSFPCGDLPWPLPNIIEIKNSSNIILSGLELREFCGRGLYINECTNIKILNCKVHDVWEGGVALIGDRINFECSEVYNTCMSNAPDYDPSVSPGWPAAIHTYRRSDNSYTTNVVIRNNKSYNSWGEAINLIRADGAIVEGNILYDNLTVFIYLDYSRNVTIRNNFGYSTTDYYNRRDFLKFPAIGIKIARECWGDYPINMTIQNVNIYNNLFARAGAGVYFYDNGKTGGYCPNLTTPFYKDIIIANNTIVNTNGGTSIFSNSNGTISGVSGIIFKNNIIEHSTNGEVLQLDGVSNAWTMSNNNWPGGIPTSIGTHTNSFALDPGFVGPETNTDPATFRLSSTSPLKTSGVPITQINNGQTNGIINYDFWGGTRNASSLSIGFHEFGTIGSFPVYPCSVIPIGLPVNLIDFDAFGHNTYVELTWATSSEFNNERFEVERSFDGQNFFKIGEVKGNGNSNSYLGYFFRDEYLNSVGVKDFIYYRLKQVDYDGVSEYSSIVYVFMPLSLSSNNKLILYLQDDLLQFKLRSGNLENINLDLYDVNGKLIKNFFIPFNSHLKDDELNVINIGDLTNGLYLVSITDKNGSYKGRFLKF